MRVIGLCGRSGSGKGVVSSAFEELGVPSVDTDEVYRKITCGSPNSEVSDCVKKLAAEFGNDILMDDGGLNRRRLAAIVFTDSDKLSILNCITHTYILSETNRMLEQMSVDGCSDAIVDAPLLFESGYDKKCDCIVMADAPEKTLVRRIMVRDGIDESDAMLRLSSQMTSEALRERVDYVIYTDTDIENIKKQAKAVLDDIRLRKVNRKNEN